MSHRKTILKVRKSRIVEVAGSVALIAGAISPALAAGDLNQQINTLNALMATTPGATASDSGLFALVHGAKAPTPEDIFTFSGVVDGTYYSNLFSASSNPVTSMTTSPTLGFAWRHSKGGDDDAIWKVSLGALSSDSREDSDKFDKSILSGGVSLEEPGWKLGPLHPVFSYGLQYIDSQFFEQHLATFHDLSAGLTGSWSPQSNKTFDHNKITYTLSGVQRFSDVEASQTHSLQAALAYSASFVDDRQNRGLAASISANDIWYSDGANAGRNDQTVRVKAELDWPSAAYQNDHSLDTLFVFKLIGQYSKNFSNRAAFENDGWTLGPSITWKIAGSR